MTIQTKMWVSFIAVATVIIIAGILGITQINSIYSVGKDVGLVKAPLANTAIMVQLHTTKATRWFEEIMAEVEEEEELIDDVWKNLDEALWHLETIVTGGTNHEETIFPIQDKIIEAKVLAVKKDLVAFIKLTHLRFDNRIHGDDDALDEQYDVLFDKTMTGVEKIEGMIRTQMATSVGDMKRMALESTLILTLATILSFFIATLAIYYLSRDILIQVGGEPTYIAHITQEVATGNLDITFDHSEEPTGIYAAIQRMVAHLKKMNAEIEQQMNAIREQEWSQTGQALLNEQMRGGLDMVQLTDQVISALSTYIKADIGVFYELKNAKTLEVLASYGYSQNEKTSFQLGEGLVGQVALKNEILYRSHTPKEATLMIQSGLAVIAPQHVIMFPVLFENAVIGVIEFGFSKEMPSTVQKDFIQHILPSIGIAMNTALARADMHLLLEDSRSQSEELQSSAEELQAQQEELRQINEELEERTHELERQYKEHIPTNPKQGLRKVTPKIESTSEPTLTDDQNNLCANDQVILIIEDDPLFVQVLTVLAQEKHFKIIIATNGKEGLELATKYTPNTIILDVGLPQMDGWTVLERLKDNPKTRHIPVQLISAQGDSVTAKKMGAVGYLQKPALPDQIGNVFDDIAQFIAKTVKTVLILVDNKDSKQLIVDLVGDETVKITQSYTQIEAVKQLERLDFDCIIIDINVAQNSGLKLLEPLCNNDQLSKIPVIVYMNRELTSSEDILLQQAMDIITVKTVRSAERLLDETTLFLHQDSAQLSQEKQEILEHLHDQHKILKHKKVLIVDDDPRNTFALTTVLEECEMEVFVAYDGQEALSVLEETPEMEIVIMDIMMPEMDGYETMQHIRAQSRFSDLPIITLTAKSMKGDKDKCLAAGANDYLSKPLDTDKLLSLMRVWLYR